MKAVIMCGGRGLRLAPSYPLLPKSLVPVNGQPVLQYQLKQLQQAGIEEIILVTGHLSSSIREYIRKNDEFGVKITFFEESFPLGTAGSLYYLRKQLPRDFILLYGDLIFDLEFKRILSFHRQKEALATLVVHPNDHPHDSDLVLIDSKSRVTGVLRKNEPRPDYYHNCVNSGIFVLQRDLLTVLRDSQRQDLETDLIFPAIKSERIFAYQTSEYIKDMGTPKRRCLVEKHVQAGIVTQKNLARKQKAIFLDRDGTINLDVGLLYKPEQLRLYPDAIPALKAVNASEYLAIIITNQPVVARNLCSEYELQNIHHRLEALLGNGGAYVDDIYYCPHHPDSGYPEENPDYKIECSCRKPGTGLLETAIRQYNINPAKSFFVGDSTVDVQTGINAGLCTILLATGQAGLDLKYPAAPHFRAHNLQQAVELILD